MVAPKDLESGLTAEKLRRILKYTPETGEWYWTYNASRNKGLLAGNISGNGYHVIMIEGVTFFAHRLAWLWMKGEWPKGQIDHIDRNRMNNKWENYRDATAGQNEFNSDLYLNNTSGFAGVTWRSSHSLWIARIGFKGKQLTIGSFRKKEDAIAARRIKELELYGDLCDSR